MTRKRELQVAIQFKESTWEDIVDLLYHACQVRGYDWIPWQREIARAISEAIEKARVPDQPYRGRSRTTRKKELEASIQLKESTWKDMVDILYHACQLRGADWIPWQREIAEIVSAALEADLPPGEPFIGNEGKWVCSDWFKEQGLPDLIDYGDMLHDMYADWEADFIDWD